MKCININYSHADVTTVSYTKEFTDSSTILQLDVLKDAIGLLTEKYNSLLAKPDETDLLGR